MILSVRDLTVVLDDRPVLDRVSVDIVESDRWAVIGRNGAGKSTLLRCMARLLRGQRGSVSVEGRDIWSVKPRDLARVVAYVPQAEARRIPYRVFDYVVMGRFAHQGPFAVAQREDHRAAWDALEITDTRYLAERTMDTLSGGELQRVLLAGAVSQGGRVLLLDEPASHLDPPHQLSIRRALQRIRDASNTAIVTITHDVNAAVQDNTHLLALVDGRVHFSGTCDQARGRAAELLREVYGMPFVRVASADGALQALLPGGGP